MSDEKENKNKSVSVEDKYDKTDNSLNNSDNNNQNENSIDPSQEVKVSTDDKISTTNVEYKKSCTMNKKKKLIIGGIAGGIILIGLIILIIILTRPKPCTGPECEIPPGRWVDYNISSKIFKTTITEETKTKFNFKRNGRRLDDDSKTITINNEILFDIYEINNDLINAYVVILSREEIENGKKKSSNDKVNDAAKVSFNKYGEIKELSFSTTSNQIIKEELKEIIEGIIPKLNIDDETPKDENCTEFNVTYEKQNHIAINEDALLGSSVISNLITNVENHNVTVFTLTKEFSLQNSEYDNDNDLISDPDSVNPKDAFKNDLETVNILIDSMKVTINMKASFDKKIDDKKTKEYENKLKEINFSSETSSNGLRLLSKEEYEKNIKLQNEVRKGFNNIRDLQSVEEFTSSMEYPFTFNYEIFKSNMLGVQVAIVASIKWIPTEGTILIKLYYVRGSKTSEIDTKTIVIENFSDVTKSYKTILITIISYLKDEIIKYIDNYNINI